jgi:hypothetical protein
MRIALPFVLLLTMLWAAEKKLPVDETSNDVLDISATPLIDKDQIRQELGSDLGGDIVVVRVQLRPVSDKPVKISLDDFLLVSSKDGQRSQPFAPSQIAGNASLVVTPQGARNGGMMGGPGISLGGISMGRARKEPEAPKPTEAKMETNPSDKPNPLLQTLKDKVLPEKEITDPLSGLLYFQMIGKFKPKDLELHYKGPAGQMALRFHP